MKKIRKAIIILIILVIIAIIAILVLLKSKYKNGIPNEIPYNGEVIVNNSLEKVNIRNNYYTVKKIVENYYVALCDLNKTNQDSSTSENEGEVEYSQHVDVEVEYAKDNLYSFFNEKYIKESGLTTNNIQEILGSYKNLYVLINEMYVRDITETTKMYFVFGNLINKDTLNKEEFELMVEVDSNNSTFNIYTSDYVKKYNLYELSKKSDFNNDYEITKIENRKYNSYEFNIIDDETYCIDLLEDYTEAIKYNLNYSYNRLDEEYKKTKFGTIEEFKKYINNHKERYASIRLEKYQKTQENEDIQYVCLDQNGNYYIFKEISPFNYIVILDTYTIDLPEFTEKYNSANEQQKVALNIDKFIKAINDKDYKYAYNCLADSYKNNYFKTQEEFENYAKQNFYTSSTVGYKQFDAKQDIYTYSVILTNEETGEQMNKTFVMKLGEGTKFELSFDK